MSNRNPKQLKMPPHHELRKLEDAQQELSHLFPSRGSLDWELRVHRAEYIASGALFEIGGRLMAHPATMAHTALAIGARKVADRGRAA